MVKDTTLTSGCAAISSLQKASLAVGSGKRREAGRGIGVMVQRWHGLARRGAAREGQNFTVDFTSGRCLVVLFGGAQKQIEGTVSRALQQLVVPRTDAIHEKSAEILHMIPR